MKIHYDKDTEMVEVIFERAENYADEIDDNTVALKAEDDDRIIGYGFDNAIQTAFENDLLTSNQKLAILLKMVRTTMNLTQEQMAEKLNGMQLRQYQRLESGDENTTLDYIDQNVKRFIPEADFTKILKSG